MKPVITYPGFDMYRPFEGELASLFGAYADPREYTHVFYDVLRHEPWYRRNSDGSYWFQMPPRPERGDAIFFTSENFIPDMDACDWAFSMRYLDHPRHMRMPLYGLLTWWNDGARLLKYHGWAENALAAKLRFCNFVAKNEVPFREQFYHLLSGYKEVDCWGERLCNCEIQAGPKRQGGIWKPLELLGQYRFTIAFENVEAPGYVTEKLMEAMFAGSIPIYWGDPTVIEQFNPASFVDVRSFGSLTEVVDYVAWLDMNDDAYLETLRQPWFHGNVPNQWCRRALVESRLREIFES